MKKTLTKFGQGSKRQKVAKYALIGRKMNKFREKDV